MTDTAAAWRASMIRHGEAAIAMRQAGRTWAEISAELYLGDVQTAQRAAALFLSADLETRKGGGEAAQ